MKLVISFTLKHYFHTTLTTEKLVEVNHKRKPVEKKVEKYKPVH